MSMGSRNSTLSKCSSLYERNNSNTMQPKVTANGHATNSNNVQTNKTPNTNNEPSTEQNQQPIKEDKVNNKNE